MTATLGGLLSLSLSLSLLLGVSYTIYIHNLYLLWCVHTPVYYEITKHSVLSYQKSSGKPTEKVVRRLECGQLEPGLHTLVLFEMGKQNAFPYTIQLYLSPRPDPSRRWNLQDGEETNGKPKPKGNNGIINIINLNNIFLYIPLNSLYSLTQCDLWTHYRAVPWIRDYGR